MERLESAMSPRVRYPDMRSDVLAALEYLSRPHTTNEEEGRGPGRGRSRQYDLEMAIHTLFDDLALHEPAESAVGDLFHTGAEEAAVLRAVKLVDEVLPPASGEALSVTALQCTPRWVQVMAAAQQAVEAMLDPGQC